MKKRSPRPPGGSSGWPSAWHYSQVDDRCGVTGRSRLPEHAHEFSIEPDIAALGFLQMRLRDRMEGRELVKGHDWIGVMLGVIGHVPGEEAHQTGREGRAGVFEHIGDMRTACMFGEKIGPEKGLPKKRWYNP